ncbi:junctional adhesion molecule-like [Clarias gariepinus]|uniref:junctional adhesion molecule-like n=1 Tax=Clarias gariepinus TaxID=13013 RepID=UPI00234DC93F|nr:junctional adhesion molecule-like [Clarias gariepinus]
MCVALFRTGVCAEDSVMMTCLYLVSVVFHVAAGCTLSGDELIKITRRRGDSVLLPCSCSDLNRASDLLKHQETTWWTSRTERWTEVLNDEHYHGRLQMFNNTSPANLSLFISDLRVEDQGEYRCSTEKEDRDIRLYVDGCELVKKTEVERVTVFTGESVVLPCVCTDIQDKPQGLKWKFIRNSHYQEIYPKQTGHHRNRVKLVSNNSPGNLSLLISDLTEEDQGVYRCFVQADRKDLRLSVKGRRVTSIHSNKTDRKPPSEQPQGKTTHSTPASSSTTLEQGKEQTHTQLALIFCVCVLLFVILAVVALICWRCRGGRCGEKMITEGHQDCKIKQKSQTVPDAVYVNVMHVNTARAARFQISGGEENEYVSIINY